VIVAGGYPRHAGAQPRRFQLRHRIADGGAVFSDSGVAQMSWSKAG
jgi:hypothetical protein